MRRNGDEGTCRRVGEGALKSDDREDETSASILDVSSVWRLKARARCVMLTYAVGLDVLLSLGDIGEGGGKAEGAKTSSPCAVRDEGWHEAVSIE